MIEFHCQTSQESRFSQIFVPLVVRVWLGDGINDLNVLLSRTVKSRRGMCGLGMGRGERSMAGDEGKGEWEKGIDERVCTTRLKKKAATYFELMNEKKKSFSVEVILKIFKFSFILDQS